MTATITWAINDLERHTADGYVHVVHYTVNAKDDAYSAGAYGSVGLERPEGDLVPFADLTAEIVMGWLKEKLGAEKVAQVEAALQARIDEQRTPTTAKGRPWQ